MATRFRTNKTMGTEYKHSTPLDCSKETCGEEVIQNDSLTPKEILERYATGMDMRRFQKFGLYDNADTTLQDLVLSAPFKDLTEVDKFIRRKKDFDSKMAIAQEIKEKVNDPNLNPSDSTPETPPTPEE